MVATVKAKKKARLSKECIERNVDQIISVAQKEGVVVNPFSISNRKTIFECPYKGCREEFTAQNLYLHLKSHKTRGIIDMIKCPFCARPMCMFNLIRHLESGNYHPEFNVKKELDQLNSSVDPKQKAIVDAVKPKSSSKRFMIEGKVTATLGSSIFDPSPTSMNFAQFRSSLRSKLIENTKENAPLIFKFAVRTNALEWGCLICKDSIGLSFKNPVSLRLHALFHLEQHVGVEYFEYLQGMITKEWSLLKKEIPTLPIDRMRTRGDLPTERSFLSYSLLRDEDCVGEVMDVIERCHVDEKTKKVRNALCLVCHSPFFVSLSTPLATPLHFLLDSHRHLKAKGWSEFHEVDEIAEAARGQGDVHSALAFSTFLHLTNERDAEPKKLFKWRCTLCSLDVAVFPSSISLRFFALRHLEMEHPKTLNDDFYRHEWSLLQMETSLVSMRRFSQTSHIQKQGRPLDITDPSDFLFPWPRCVRVPSPDYYTCGHCFFVSTAAEIKDHLTTHGYVGGDSASSRLVVEDGGKEAMINEKTIRTIRKALSVPVSILYEEPQLGGTMSKEEKADEEEEEEEEEEETPVPDRPSTPIGRAKSTVTASLMDTPKSAYTLRARSVATRYVPLTEEETTNNETMSSEESDSGLEKNYQTMSGDDDTMEETEGGEDDDDMMETTLRSVASSSNSSKRKGKAKNANTCTESSVSFDDLYDAGIIPPMEKGVERRREKERVHEKAFKWEGEEPAQLNAEQVELIREFKEGGRCSLCPRAKGYRGVGRMTNVEQSMMAHLIVHHADNIDAMAVVDRKRYLLSKSLESGAVVETVPPFLLQSVHKHYLTCSRCLSFKCTRQSNLAVHWETCSGVRGNRWRTTNRKEEKKEEEEKEEGEGEKSRRSTPKRVMNSVRCPLCREGWRKSVHYSDDVSVAIHLLLKHTTDQKAYTMAMQLEEETNLQSSYPFIHLSDSFTLRAEQPSSGIQCALCDTNSPALSSAIRHATRSHASAKEKSAANFTPGSLTCPLSSCSISMKSVLCGRPRSVPALHFLHVLYNHDCKEDKAKQFMTEFPKSSDAEQLRTETNLRLNVEESVQLWLSGLPRLVCSLCEYRITDISRYTHHFEERNCGGSEDKSKRRRRGTTPSPWAGLTPKKDTNATEMSTMEALADLATPKRGRGRAPETGRPCAHCDRVIYSSDCYAASISMDLHLLKMHPDKERVSAPTLFPFIDFSRSSDDSLQCALCEYTAKESRYFLPHAWTKHTNEATAAQGVAALSEYMASADRKKAKQRLSCSRPMKRMRMQAKERSIHWKDEAGDGGEMREDEDEEGPGDVKRARIVAKEESAPPTATALVRTPRQRSTVSRWLDTAMADTSTYSPASTAKVDEDLRGRLDRLFSNVDSPASSQQQQQPAHGSSSIFRELPETSMSRIASSGRAEDISHIKGVEGVRCSVCAFKGRDTESLRIHFNEAHQEVASLSVPEVYPCAACSRVFNNKKKWRCHCEEDHKPKDRPFQCPKCEFRYETHQKLRAHQIRVHESEILVHPDDRTCRQCNKLFASLRAYQNHKKRHELRERIAEEEEEE